MLFITNRNFNEGKQSTINRRITFALDDNAPSNAIYCCLRENINQYIEIGFDQFMQKIQKNSYSQILFYIHGFNNLPEADIFPAVAKLQHYFDQQEKNLMYVVPIIWPCDNDLGIIKDYWDDTKAADMSGFSFSRLLSKFVNYRYNHTRISCSKRINIFAHSMGNRLLRETLNIWNRYETLVGVPRLIRNIYMIAADIKNDSLEFDQTGEFIAQAARNVIIYYANDDLVLNSSKIANFNGKFLAKRLGNTGPANLEKVPVNVYAVDCDDFNNLYDPPLGHNYFINKISSDNPGVIFEHIYNTAKSGRVAHNNQERIVLKNC